MPTEIADSPAEETCLECNGSGRITGTRRDGSAPSPFPCGVCAGTGRKSHYATSTPPPDPPVSSPNEAETRAHTQRAREQLCCCLNCGRNLSFLDTLSNRKTHRDCTTFTPAPGKGEIYMYCRGCEMVTRGTPSEITDSFGSSRTSRKCGLCHRFE